MAGKISKSKFKKWLRIINILRSFYPFFNVSWFYFNQLSCFVSEGDSLAAVLFPLVIFKQVTESSLTPLCLILKSHFITAILNPHFI